MSTAEQLERRHRLNELMDIYGELLTDRQKLFLDLHVAEDLSFGEIADQHQVSRQAVHDSVKHAEMSLENFENKLGLLEKGFHPKAGLSNESPAPSVGHADAETSAQSGNPASGTQNKSSGNPSGPAIDPALISSLDEIIAELKKSGGVIYNADEVAAKLTKIRSAFPG